MAAKKSTSTAKKSTSKKVAPAKLKPGPGRLDWKPKTFEEAVAATAKFNRIIVTALSSVGLTSLSCPAPKWDPSGQYRVAIGASGVAEVQRADAAGGWQPAKTTR